MIGKLHFSPNAATHGFVHRDTHDAMYDVYHEEESWTSDYVRWLAEERFDGDVEAVVERANEDERAFNDRNSLYQFLMGSNWRTEGEHSNSWVTDRSVDYLRDHREDPFFLFTSYFGPHQPMLAPGKWEDLYDPDEIELPPEFDVNPEEKPIVAARMDDSRVFRYFRDHDWPEARYRKVLAAYYGHITMIDAGIGCLLDELDQLGIRDETVVVFTSDHAGQFGWFFKETMYEGAVRVPLIVSDPTFEETTGSTTDHVVSNLDLFSTLIERCGVEYDEQSRSRDLLPLLENPENSEWTDEVYSELNDQLMFISGDYKLIRTSREDSPVYELYNNAEPPFDGTDRWDEPELQNLQDRMVRMMTAKRRETDTGKRNQT